jgi:hypothetical protein
MGWPKDVNSEKSLAIPTLNIKVIFSENFGSLVNRFTRTVENTSQHIFGNRHTECIPGKFDASVLDINTRGTFKDLDRLALILIALASYLNDSSLSGDFKDLARSL